MNAYIIIVVVIVLGVDSPYKTFFPYMNLQYFLATHK